ncbi:MAG TPA: adenosylcobinamide-phosphate synthase CbiB [Acidimicrobiales bacterium]|nr:adenosylcobinamide-phosphate synthase CbiB [Acidimicrobiales bacterium]
MRWRRRAGAVALGLLVDRALGEPPTALHPVAHFGQAMERLEARRWEPHRGAGVRYALSGAAIGVAGGRLGTLVLGPSASLVAATATAAAGRSLLSSARAVGRALEDGDTEGARRLLPSLVGRDPEGLDEKEMARAVIESVAENLSDAVVATAFWGVVAGTEGVLVHRAVNTMDAMVGHRSPRYERFGWAAARLDDMLAWPAARLSALLVAAVTPGATKAVWSAIREQAAEHPSPNAGVAEAAFAAALGLRLGGVNRYEGREEVRPPLGWGRPPEPADVARAVALADRAILLLTALCAAPGFLSLLRQTSRRGSA